MKGTATVTTTTTVMPVVLTEIKKGVVLSVGPASVTVKDEADGLRKRFTQAQLNDRGIKIVKDGKVTHISDVKAGDELMAVIVSKGPPAVVTEQEVQATLAQATPDRYPRAPRRAAPRPRRRPRPPLRRPRPAATAATTAPPTMAASPASAAVAASGFGTTGWVIIILLIAVALYFFSRRRKPPQ